MEKEKCYICGKKLTLICQRYCVEIASKVEDYIVCSKCSISVGKKVRELKKEQK